MTRSRRIELLRAALSERLLVLDGAMGTAIQGKGLSAADFGGAELEGCNEILVASRPEVVEAIHAAYFEAGADIAETDSFGGTPIVLAEYGLAERALELNREAARLARRVADRFSTPAQLRFVAGSMGPTTKSLSVTGGVTFEELEGAFHLQAKGLWEGGVDYLLLETCQDTRNVKAALLGIQRLAQEIGEEIPVAVSGTIEPMGTMLAGQSVEALVCSLEHVELLYIGLNCGTGPEAMADHVRSLAALARWPTACVPNAGLPDENGRYLETPEAMARTLFRFGEAGWLNLVGGCCGTTEEHVRALVEMARGLAPRVPHVRRRSWLSGIDAFEVTDEVRPALVGERTNVIGSRKFKELVAAERWDDASEIARAQIAGGAQIVDVCLANPDRDEAADMRRFLASLVSKVRVPLMIDSTDDRVIAEALTYCQGKALINSVNLEDGEERFAKVVPLSRRFGAALVVGCIDDDPRQGMAVTRERKLAVARRSFELLTRKYGVPPEDVYWDPLVFPCATGDAQYVGSAAETIEGVRLLKEAFPGTRTLLGISNVSFGLPAAGREVLNSVFLYHCTRAGLDLAIVNAERLVRYPEIPADERTLAEDLLWNRGADPVGAFAARFRDRRAAERPREELPLDDRLARYVVQGTREGLEHDLELALRDRTPLDLVNGPLMRGMDEVGRLFAKNELIVAEVLQSAESMKAAVRFLEPRMDRKESSTRGTVLLATVKGDVHDIGKNLVEIILANNGFRVVNLGIKVPPAQLVEAVRAQRPDVVGLSGLLVKSAQQMVVTAEELRVAGIAVPLLVGGAALSRAFVDRQIAPAYGEGLVAYAKDAMTGLELCRRVCDAAERGKLREELARARAATQGGLGASTAGEGPSPARPASPQRPVERSISIVAEPPAPPDLERHVLRSTPLEEIWRHVNPVMLYGRHLGLPGSAARAIAEGDEKKLAGSADGRKALELREVVREVERECVREGLLAPAAVFQFFRAGSEGDRLLLFGRDGPAGDAIASFQFPRQPRPRGLCLADLVNPLRGAPPDHVALFVVTAGKGVRAYAEALKGRGDYLRSHVLQALALESAEGYAELLHAELRARWGFPDPEGMAMADRFRANYRGKRYSFGYPACPALEDQRILFGLLRPEEIGVVLTDGDMMDPEASVSAMVFHHPEASYFSAAARE